MKGLFSTLHLEIESTGERIPITCIGRANLEYRISEALNMKGVRIVGIESDKKMSTDFQAFLDQAGATCKVEE